MTDQPQASASPLLLRQDDPPHLPSFVRTVLDPSDPSRVIGVDWWPLTDDPELEPGVNCALGTLFANEAVKYARARQEWGAIARIVGAIHEKIRAGLLVPGNMEAGFFSRLCQLAYFGSLN
jgi:hypothetical protein